MSPSHGYLRYTDRATRERGGILEIAGSGYSENLRDDSALIGRAASDPEAYAQLYYLHVDGVFRYVRTYTESDEDAADLTQQVFLRILEALPKYRDRGVPFRAWLFRIARNAAIDTYRVHRRNLPWDHFPETVHPFSADLDERMIRQEAINRLRVMVGQLPLEKQELLALRFAAGLTAREIAPLVGRSEAAVKQQFARTLQNLRKAYGNE